MASTLTRALANRRRPEDEAELALRHGLERVRYGVLDRDPFGHGDVLEVSYAGPAAGVAAFVEASANGGLPVGLASSTTTRPSTRCSPTGSPASWTWSARTRSSSAENPRKETRDGEDVRTHL